MGSNAKNMQSISLLTLTLSVSEVNPNCFCFMNNIKRLFCMFRRLLLSATILLLLSSCLKETAVPTASSFEVTIAEDKTSPVTVKLQNNSYGADEYEWTFEGGAPASSRDRAPESVTFTEAGEHKIRLRVWNTVEERISEQIIRVDSAMSIDFDYAIAINDIAPGVVSISNKSRGDGKTTGISNITISRIK